MHPVKRKRCQKAGARQLSNVLRRNPALFSEEWKLFQREDYRGEPLRALHGKFESGPSPAAVDADRPGRSGDFSGNMFLRSRAGRDRKTGKARLKRPDSKLTGSLPVDRHTAPGVAEAARTVKTNRSGGNFPQGVGPLEKHRREYPGQSFGDKTPSLRSGPVHCVNRERQYTDTDRYHPGLLRKPDESGVTGGIQNSEAECEDVRMLVEPDEFLFVQIGCEKTVRLMFGNTLAL